MAEWDQGLMAQDTRELKKLLAARHRKIIARLLSAIADQAGISLQNARMLTELRLVNADLHEMVHAQAHLLHTIQHMSQSRGTGTDTLDDRQVLDRKRSDAFRGRTLGQESSHV
jgi:hypothetical protein